MLCLHMHSCGAGGTGIDRLSALVGWHCGAATQCAGFDRRALCVHSVTATPASECTFHRNYMRLSVRSYSVRERRAGGERGAAEPNLSRLTVPIKDINERRTSLKIVYATWHVWRRDVCMPFDTSDGLR